MMSGWIKVGIEFIKALAGQWKGGSHPTAPGEAVDTMTEEARGAVSIAVGPESRMRRGVTELRFGFVTVTVFAHHVHRQRPHEISSPDAKPNMPLALSNESLAPARPRARDKRASLRTLLPIQRGQCV